MSAISCWKLVVRASTTMLVPSQDWYLIGLGPMVSCGQVADLTKFSGFLVSLVCKPPHFS